MCVIHNPIVQLLKVSLALLSLPITPRRSIETTLLEP